MQLASVSQGSHWVWLRGAKALHAWSGLQAIAPQSLGAKHSTQAPLEVSHAGVAERPAQLACSVQATQVWLVHTGVEAGQSPLALQATQVLAVAPALVSHTGVPSVQAAVLSDVQATQRWATESQATSAQTCVPCMNATDDTHCRRVSGGVTPYCDATAHTCVACTTDAHCTMASAPACDLSTHACVACTADAHCPMASAPACDLSTHTCGDCALDEDCMHLPSGTRACDTSSGACVRCTEATDCGGMACKPDHACSAFAPSSQTQCEPCDTDANCMMDHYCVSMTYRGAPHGSYCLKDATVAGCVQPFSIPITGRSSLDEHRAPYCGINESQTTCEAVNALVLNTACRSGLDGDCPEGGLCRTVGFTSNRCTYECIDVVECKLAPLPGSTCGAGGTGGVSYCGGI